MPNATLLTDGPLLRVAFMAHHDAMVFCNGLTARGLVAEQRGEWQDFVLMDQRVGAMEHASWLAAGRLAVGGGAVMAGWLAGAAPGEVVVPKGWRFEGSLTQRSAFVREEEIGRRFRRERGEGNVDVMVDVATGERTYVGRTVGPQDREAEVHSSCELAHMAVKLTERRLLALAPGPERPREAQVLRADFGAQFLPRLEALAAATGAHLPEAHYVLGEALRIMDRREEAVSAFERAHRLSAPWESLSIGIVQCMLELGWFEGALRFAEPSVEQFPESLACWGNLAAAYAGVERLAEATLAIERALALDPANAINLRIQEEIESRLRRTRAWPRRFGLS